MTNRLARRTYHWLRSVVAIGLVAVIALSVWRSAAARPSSVVALANLTLTSMCSPDPNATRTWRVTNPNPVDIAFTWDVYGTAQAGQGVAPANLQVYFDSIPEGGNTARIFVDGVLNSTKASGGAQCATPTPTATATATETALPTDTPTATATATETALPTDTPTATATATETALPTDTPTATPTATPWPWPTEPPIVLPSATFTLSPTPNVPVVFVSAPTLSGIGGQPVTVTVTINALVPSRAAQFRLKFDPAVLRCEGVDEGPFYKTWAQAQGAFTLMSPEPTCDNIAGTTSDIGVAIMGGPLGGASGSGVMATVRFTAVGAGVSPLTITNSPAYDDGTHSLDKHLLFTIASAALAGQVTVTPPAWDVNGDHLINVGDIGQIGLRFGNTGAPGWIVEDVNRDGAINIGDVGIVGIHWGETW